MSEQRMHQRGGVGKSLLPTRPRILQAKAPGDRLLAGHGSAPAKRSRDRCGNRVASFP